MGRRLTDAQRVLRYVATADVAEVRQTLDLAKVVVQARDGGPVKAKRRPRKAKAVVASVASEATLLP